LFRRLRLASLTTAVAVAAVAAPASAAVPVDSSALVAAVDAADINQYMEDLQDIADANGGTRASGTPGYEESVEYVAGTLGAAGYDVAIQPFDFEFVDVLEAVMDVVSPPPGESYEYNVDFFEGFGSPNGTAEDTVVAIDVLFHTNAESTSTSGCEVSDFEEAGFEAGNIALIQRGSCDFVVKVANAQLADASGVIIFNEGNTDDRTDIIFPDLTGGPTITIPVLGTNFEIGQDLVELSEADEGLVMRIALDIFVETRTTWNVLAELHGERDDRVVLLGAHLDSVLEGPGINDNGSGSAMILEMAVEMAESEPVNTVRFAWWGAEEAGLLGAEHYVSQLSKAELKDIAVNLNFDMVASPNYVRFVYDGDAGPVGSGVVEDVFLDWFASQDLETEPTEFDGRSDYGPFILRGVPAGGLFTGAEGIKTEEEAGIYGGDVGEQYDPCYHAVCDTIANVNLEVLEQMADAAAHATMTFAMTSAAVSGTSKGNANGHVKDLDFTGPRAIR
jgi:Zn-dependent M28 family amino/carboxypeptidase